MFQFTAGALSVLFLGVLNRVLRVELGLDLFLVTLLIGGGHYLGALVAIPFGYYSDRYRVAGYRRTAHIIIGAVVATAVLAGSPWVAVWLAGEPTTPRIAAAFAYFLLEGISTFIAGTAYLALITDRTAEAERGRATGVVWTLLMVGIIVTGVSAGTAMGEYEFGRFAALFGASALIAVALILFALWRQEPRVFEPLSVSTASLRAALKMVIQSRQSRWFAAFLLVSMFSYFMQDVILEPFGGEVFALSPSATTRFNAYMGVGLILGMLYGGVRLIPQRGKRWVTALGCWIIVVAFAGLAASGFFQNARLLPLVIGALGLGAGFFTVGAVALMMDMTSTAHTGLFVGAWTLVQALAKGPASLVGGALQSSLVSLGVVPGVAYGAVFAFEATGMLIAIAILSRVAVRGFQREINSFGALAAEAID